MFTTVKKILIKVFSLEEDTIVSKTEKELLLEAYQIAKEEWYIAQQNFEYANEDFAEIAILELKAKVSKVNAIIKKLKNEGIIVNFC